MAGAGVGEAMLLGAVMGGGSAALTGGDPLKGAMMGGLTGGIGGAAGPALSSLTGGAPAAGALTGTGLTASAAAPGLTAGTAGSTLGSSLGNSLVGLEPTLGASTNFALSSPTTAGLNISNSVAGLNPALAQGGMQGGTSFALNAPTTLPGASSGYALGAPSIAPGADGGLPSLLDKTAATAPITTPSGLPSKDEMFSKGMKKFMDDPIDSIKRNPFTAAGAAFAGANAGKKKLEEEEEYSGPLSRFKYNPDAYRPSGYADGGITSLGYGGYDQMVGEEPMYMSNMAAGGIADLGSYSDGGRMLKGPGDGMSDSIPANIAGKRPARLADGEFVIPADVVSHLGNGSTDAGAKQLYAMMAKVRKARTGRKAQGREINPRQYMAA